MFGSRNPSAASPSCSRRRHATAPQAAPSGGVTTLTLAGTTHGRGSALENENPGQGIRVLIPGLVIVTGEVHFYGGGSGDRTVLLQQGSTTIREAGIAGINLRMPIAASVLVETVPVIFRLAVYVTGGSNVNIGEGNAKDVGITVTHITVAAA